MISLDNDWLTEEPIDFEYKKYVILAYEQQNNKYCTEEKKIYPYFSDVQVNHSKLHKFIVDTHEFKDSNKSIKTIDWVNKKLIYESKIKDCNIEEVLFTAQYSKSILETLIKNFKELYNKVEKCIEINGDPITMADFLNGYLVVNINKTLKFYYYTLSSVIDSDPYHVLGLEEISEGNYYNNRFKKCSFEVDVMDDYPYEESIYPVLKRKFLKLILNRRAINI